MEERCRNGRTVPEWRNGVRQEEWCGDDRAARERKSNVEIDNPCGCLFSHYSTICTPLTPFCTTPQFAHRSPSTQHFPLTVHHSAPTQHSPLTAYCSPPTTPPSPAHTTFLFPHRSPCLARFPHFRTALLSSRCSQSFILLTFHPFRYRSLTNL